jgi:hypothetical protein
MNPWLWVLGVAVIAAAPIAAVVIGAREPDRAEPRTEDTLELPKIKRTDKG